MVNTRALKERITSVQNIRQITRAMEMVATTKLRRFQMRAETTAPYAREVRALTAHLATSAEAREGQALFAPGAGTTSAYLLITSDRGLCGAYNTNAFNRFKEALAARPEHDSRVYLIGKKGLALLRKAGLEPERDFSDPPLEKADFRTAQAISRLLVGDFLDGAYTDLTLVYTQFHSMAKYEPKAEQLLPVDPEVLSGDGEESSHADVDWILEPGLREILETLLPKYLEVQVFNAMIQSLTSEFASRRVSMKNATDAAGDMQEELTRTYNRARQESITKELLDIVGAAEALR